MFEGDSRSSTDATSNVNVVSEVLMENDAFS